MTWLMLIHQLPPKPAYLRVKIWRRLQALGAVAVKNSRITSYNVCYTKLLRLRNLKVNLNFQVSTALLHRSKPKARRENSVTTT